MFRISRLSCYILIILTVGLLQANLWAFPNEPKGFKGYEWGVDLSQETKSFTGPRPHFRLDKYMYDTHRCKVPFSASGKTVVGCFFNAYTFNNQFMAADVLIKCEDFVLWETVFSKLYGKPKIKKWSDGKRRFFWKGQTVEIRATEPSTNNTKSFTVKFYNINLNNKYEAERKQGMKQKNDDRRKKYKEEMKKKREERLKKKNETGGF